MNTNGIPINHAEAIGVNLLNILYALEMTTAGQVAGSIRRRIPFVKDIELLVFPRFGQDRNKETQLDLFSGQAPDVNLLNAGLEHLFDTTPLVPGDKNGDKYKQWKYTDMSGIEIKIDCFICHDVTQWGLLLALRTGSADFMAGIATHVKRTAGIHWYDARLWRDTVSGERVQHVTPTEDDFFKAVGFQQIPRPEDRNKYAVYKLLGQTKE